MIKGQEFLNYLGFENPTEYEIAAVNLLNYHSHGPSEKKPVNKRSIIYRLLKDEGMELYKKIFDNNCKEMVRRFFNDDFILKLWPHIV